MVGLKTYDIYASFRSVYLLLFFMLKVFGFSEITEDGKYDSEHTSCAPVLGLSQLGIFIS